MTAFEDQRSTPRIDMQSRLFLELRAPEADNSEPGEILRSKTLDVSRDGLKVLLDRPLPANAILRIGVELPGMAEALYLAVEVRWTRQQSDTDWIVGLLVMNASGSDVYDWRDSLQRA